MKLIIKKHSSLLREASYEEAVSSLGSKNYRKKIYNLILNNKDFIYEIYATRQYDDVLLTLITDSIKQEIPQDISDKQKALALNWLKSKVATQEGFKDFLGIDFGPIRSAIERFFQYNGSSGQMPNFIEPIEKKDLNRVESIGELENLIADADPRYKEYIDDKDYADASKGTEKIIESDEWEVYIPHNKGAACQLGKGTSWCTAAPGLDYYEEYHQEDDPLFIFINKSDPRTKYQFHFGTKQFMDRNDQSIEIENKSLLPILYDLLKQNKIDEKYPIINNISFIEEDGIFYKVQIESRPIGRVQKWSELGDPIETTHRIDGPAVISDKGDKFWYYQGKLHRDDGPAVEYAHGGKQWFLFGKKISQEQFDKMLKKLKLK